VHCVCAVPVAARTSTEAQITRTRVIHKQGISTVIPHTLCVRGHSGYPTSYTVCEGPQWVSHIKYHGLLSPCAQPYLVSDIQGKVYTYLLTYLLTYLPASRKCRPCIVTPLIGAVSVALSEMSVWLQTHPPTHARTHARTQHPPTSITHPPTHHTKHTVMIVRLRVKIRLL
jgi:hypothetical protein